MTSITIEREEPLGFVSCFVEYEIDGTVSPYSPATFDEPADGGEAEIDEVTRLHPLTGERRILSSNEWPFSNEEQEAIETALVDSLQDSSDDYDGPEDFYDDPADDYIP